MKKLLFVLCFLTVQLKAQTLMQVLANGNNAGHKNIWNIKNVKCDGIINNDSSGIGLDITATGATDINILASKRLTLQATSGGIIINPNGQGGIILNGKIGIGQGSNWSAHSPVNCIDYPIYTSQSNAISNGLDEGDHWLKRDSIGDYMLMVVHISQ